MRLRREWKNIIKRAWSVRFTLLAGVFTTAEAVVPVFVDAMPRGVFVALSAVSIIGAMVSRVVAQENLSND